MPIHSCQKNKSWALTIKYTWSYLLNVTFISTILPAGVFQMSELAHQFLKQEGTVMTVWLLLSLIIFTIDLVIPLGVAAGVPYIAVVLISLASKHHKSTIIAAILCTCLTILGYMFSPDGGESWQVILNRFLAIFAIWVTALLSLKIIEQTETELKVLQGLLPICASCKNIRDNEGNWKQLETYIKQHSEAEFSHGMCPHCLQEHYPNLQQRLNR